MPSVVGGPFSLFLKRKTIPQGCLLPPLITLVALFYTFVRKHSSISVIVGLFDSWGRPACACSVLLWVLSKSQILYHVFIKLSAPQSGKAHSYKENSNLQWLPKWGDGGLPIQCSTKPLHFPLGLVWLLSVRHSSGKGLKPLRRQPGTGLFLLLPFLLPRLNPFGDRGCSRGALQRFFLQIPKGSDPSMPTYTGLVVIEPVPN